MDLWKSCPEVDSVHPIQMVARLTGMSANLIRVWEHRYGAVEPSRSATKRRLYSEQEIERLKLLKELTGAGHSIGQIAKLPEEKLQQLAGKEWHREIPAKTETGAESATPWEDEALEAIHHLDSDKLEAVLKNATATLGTQGVLQRLIAPLAETVGEQWRTGKLTAAHEHFASWKVREFLSALSKPFAGGNRGPVIVFVTPAGQLHEMGALMAGAMAANLGWQVVHLGVSLPAPEIAGAARQKGARAVALSLIYPEDDPELPKEIALLRELLPKDVALIAGGRAMGAYRKALTAAGALLAEDLVNLGLVLDGLRRPKKSA